MRVVLASLLHKLMFNKGLAVELFSATYGSTERSIDSKDGETSLCLMGPWNFSTERTSYAVPGHHNGNAARSAGAGAGRLWSRRVRIAADLPAESRRRLRRRGRPHRRDRPAWGQNHAGDRDTRVGLCRPAVYG